MQKLQLYCSMVLVLSICVKECQSADNESQRLSGSRPNILFIMADDHAQHGLSCYESPFLKTPQIDRLAREGMRFTHAFGVNSLCAPARAALLTGKHSHINGKKTNADPFDGRQATFPALLQDAGYETAIVGKWHLKVVPTGFDYYKVMPGHGVYFDCRFRESGRGDSWKLAPGYLTDVITDSSIEWLESRESNKPFCLMVHHKAPHGPDIHKKEHAKLYEDMTIPSPQTLHDNWDTREVLKEGECHGTKLINLSWQQDIYRQLMRTAPEEKEARTEIVYQQVLKGYMRLVASLDENVGRLLNYIDDSGLRENTLVIYTSDNGFFLGEHGLYNKMWMYEESMRIPLLIRFPEYISEGKVNSELVNVLDFAPTFLDLAGAEIPSNLQGTSLVPLLEGTSPKDWRDGMYYHYYHGYGIPEHYGLRTNRYKLIHFPQHKDGTYWELFDLEQDPHELVNRYTDQAFADVRRELHAQLKATEEKSAVERGAAGR